MKRTISSSFASIFKMLTLFITVMMSLMFVSNVYWMEHIPWTTLILLGGMLALFLWITISRKTVQIDDSFLYVSVFRRVATIPLKEIEKVTECIGMNDRCVIIHFRNNTQFGRSISFTPTSLLSRLNFDDSDFTIVKTG